MSSIEFTADPSQFDRSAPLDTPADFDFPHPPYAIQQQFMSALFECIDQRAIGIFESPTGTGKSLSLMCAALRWLRSHERVFRHELADDIAGLQAQIDAAEVADGTKGGGGGDWLTAQSGTLELKQRLAARKRQLEVVKAADGEHLRRRERHRGLVRAKVHRYGCQGKRALAENKAESRAEGAEVGDDEFVLRNDEEDDEDAQGDEEEFNRNEPPPRQPHQPQIFFCSRTHSQLSQVVHEVRKTSFARDAQEPSVRVAVLASRQSYCINAAVRRLSSSAQINERCLEMQKCKANAKASQRESKDGLAVKKRRIVVAASANCRCEHYSQPRIAQMRDQILSEVLDIEELVGSTAQTAETSGSSAQPPAACPYYAARLAATAAQLVMLPYQMLLHRRTRQQMRLDLRDSVVIIDEGHNLLDTLAAMHSAELRLVQLQSAHRQLSAYKSKYFERFSTKNLLRLNQLLFVCNRLVQLLEKGAPESRMLRAHELMAEAEFDHQPLAEILEFSERTHLAQKVHGFALKFGTAMVEVKPVSKTSRGDYLKRLAEKRGAGNVQKSKPEPEDIKPPVTESPRPEDGADSAPNSSVIRPLLAFLDCLLQASADGRVLISCVEAPSQSQRSLKYLLLNPAASFADILADCRSVIIAGGTMQPTAELRTQLLATQPASRIREYFYDHVVPATSILPLTVATGPTATPLHFNFANRTAPALLAELQRVLRNICSVSPAGVVVFFSSYDYLDAFCATLPPQAEGGAQLLAPIAGKRVFREPRGSQSAARCEQMLANYSRAAQTATGALLLSVVGGKLSEGLNFSDDLGRVVCVVGLPFPNRGSPELAERMRWLDSSLRAGAGDEYYENLCMKAVNQCIGRAIRHIGDYAAVLLLDQRYEGRRAKLPAWIGRSLVTGLPFGAVQSRLARFFREKRGGGAKVNC